MHRWWKEEGSTCSNAWSGIINPAANEIKNRQFPSNKGSSTRRARNQGARLGIDSEVRNIQDECFSDNDMADADEASFISVESDFHDILDPPRPWEICSTLRTQEECERTKYCSWYDENEDCFCYF